MNLNKIKPTIICMLLFAGTVLLKAEEPAPAAAQQLLLLRNGQALEGRISRSGDIYHVALPNGEIRIKQSDVELLCKDFEEGYQRKRASIPVGSIRDHLDLAQWSQRNKLFDHAAAELDAAAAIAPGSPVVTYLQRRLQMTVHPPPDPPKAETAGDQSLSNQELDRMIRNLPHKAVENFTQSVQPLLMNHCTMAGCHGPQSETGLRLERISADQPAGRRLTQRNIYAVLQYVNRNNPLASKILTVPTAPHGGAKTAVFSDHQAMQYKRLVDWVIELSPAAIPESLPAHLDNQHMLAETAPELGSAVVGAIGFRQWVPRPRKTWCPACPAVRQCQRACHGHAKVVPGSQRLNLSGCHWRLASACSQAHACQPISTAADFIQRGSKSPTPGQYGTQARSDPVDIPRPPARTCRWGLFLRFRRPALEHQARRRSTGLYPQRLLRSGNLQPPVYQTGHSIK